MFGRGFGWEEERRVQTGAEREVVEVGAEKAEDRRRSVKRKGEKSMERIIARIEGSRDGRIRRNLGQS